MAKNSISLQMHLLAPLNIEVVGSATDKGNGECWMNIKADRLETAAANHGIIVFVCVIKTKTYAYGIHASTLLEAFKTNNVTINTNGQKYDFRIQYSTGRLIRNNQHNELIAELQPTNI